MHFSLFYGVLTGILRDMFQVATIDRLIETETYNCILSIYPLDPLYLGKTQEGIHSPGE